jgi:hypothetical protein
LGHWGDRLIDQASDVPSIIFSFIISCKILSAPSPSQQPTVLLSIYQNITWTIRCLVDEVIDSVTQQQACPATQRILL